MYLHFSWGQELLPIAKIFEFGYFSSYKQDIWIRFTIKTLGKGYSRVPRRVLRWNDHVECRLIGC